ncbi:KpsF/GutQ family sugar-phosphate isomerase [Halocola ammonii]
MENKINITDSATNTLRLEAEAVSKLIEYIDGEFEKIVRLILASKGRVVFTGIGKSANIANKLVATFNSTGTPALFMHAADAIHGDLGNVQKDDIVLCISKSGNSPEIKVLVPLVKNLGNKIVGMTGNLNGFLARHSDFVLNTTVEKEACPNNLAPTTSTTAQLAMGDAVAISLMECRGFSERDFARYHPGGALGKRLYLQMGDLLQEENKPEVEESSTVEEVIVEISTKRLGATAVTAGGALTGVITDGDIRRMLQNKTPLESTSAKDIMSKNPKSVDVETLVVDGFRMMESNNITQLIVTRDGAYAGIVHLHDILKEGIY